MRLLIVADTSHWIWEGKVYGHGSTVREVDHLAKLFDEVRFLTFVHPGAPPAFALPYESDNVTLVPAPPAGGDSLRAKWDVLRRAPGYARAVLRELASADVVHLRCPASISALAAALLAGTRKPRTRWAKYAGDWNPRGRGEPWTYRLQRWWLRNRFHRGIVTINGNCGNPGKGIHSLPNPCLTEEELAQGRAYATGKQLQPPVRVAFVGRLSADKGARKALQIVAAAVRAGVDARIDIVGDGAERSVLETLASDWGIQNRVTFHGWMPRPCLARIYRQAHIVLLPSSSEGWPKVLSEGMAYGAVPLASHVGSIPYYLGRCGISNTFDPEDLEGFVGRLRFYYEHPNDWKADSETCVRSAPYFSYAGYIREIARLLGLSVGL